MKEQIISILQENNNTLHGVLWTNDDSPKAVLQITHGMTEHIFRYKEFAEALTAQGIAVAGFDLRGHGRNLSNSGCATFTEDGWDGTLKDIQLFSEFLAKKYPKIVNFIRNVEIRETLVNEMKNGVKKR